MQDFKVRSMLFGGYPCKYDIKSQFVTIVTRMLSFLYTLLVITEQKTEHFGCYGKTMCHTRSKPILLFTKKRPSSCPYMESVDSFIVVALFSGLRNILDENDINHRLLLVSSTGRRPASLCHGPLSVCPSVR